MTDIEERFPGNGDDLSRREIVAPKLSGNSLLDIFGNRAQRFGECTMKIRSRISCCATPHSGTGEMPWHGKADHQSQSYKLEIEHDERVSRVSGLVEQGSKSPGRCGDNARYPANHSRVRDDEATLDFGALRR